jgi:hypothetical protein
MPTSIPGGDTGRLYQSQRAALLGGASITEKKMSGTAPQAGELIAARTPGDPAPAVGARARPGRPSSRVRAAGGRV